MIRDVSGGGVLAAGIEESKSLAMLPKRLIRRSIEIVHADLP